MGPDGPMGISEDGHKYVLTVVDVMTRYLIAVPLKSKEAIEVLSPGGYNQWPGDYV